MASREAFGLSVSTLKARLRDHPTGAFAFWGPEELLKQFYLQKFQDLIRKEGAEEFNSVRLDLTRDHSLTDVLNEGEILPFMGEKRLVTVHGLRPAAMTEKDVKQLLNFLETLPDYLILIFYLEWEDFGSDKKDLTRAAVKKLAAKLDFVQFPLQDERVLLPWSRKILAADSVNASDSALRLLFRLGGNRMILIRKQLDQLACYAIAQKKSTVEEEDVFLFASDTTEGASWQLCNAMLEGSAEAAMEILDRLKRQEEEPVLLASAVSRMLTGALLCREGADAAACYAAAGLATWQFDRYQRAVRGKDPRALQKAAELCLEWDRRLKGARADAVGISECYCLEILHLLRNPS